jgi:RNA polymerase sigma factor (sigma-70 family)
LAIRARALQFSGMLPLSDGGPAPYPSTRLSVILAARQDDPEIRRAAFDTLVRVYWRPVYTRLRLKWRAQPADAEDLTQEFFARAMDRGFFDGFDPARARFRTFLRLCLDRFAANARRDERRLKRGGGVRVVPLDIALAERELADGDAPGREADPDSWFDREWVRALFADAVQELRAQCSGTAREIRFQVFERHDLHAGAESERPGYRELATTLGLPVTQITNHLAWSRRELRRLVLERLRVVSGSDAEFRDEAAELFGAGGP